jgi:hypothetical protein
MPSVWFARYNEVFGESPSGKAPDFDSGIRRFDPYLPSQFPGMYAVSRALAPILI